jgi:hypothetical protein
MAIVRNISDQPFFINRKGTVIQLFPKRAATVTDSELTSPQVQSLLKGGFVQLVELKKEKKSTSRKTVKDKTDKDKKEKTIIKEKTEKKPDDK